MQGGALIFCNRWRISGCRLRALRLLAYSIEHGDFSFPSSVPVNYGAHRWMGEGSNPLQACVYAPADGATQIGMQSRRLVAFK